MSNTILSTVLRLIAVSVMAIAYGLFTTRTPMAAAYSDARPMVASQRVGLVDDAYALPQTTSSPYARVPIAYPVSDVRALPDSAIYATPRRADATVPVAVTPVRRTVVERAPARSWQKTAMVIGGSSAAGAGLGAIFGGK